MIAKIIGGIPAIYLWGALAIGVAGWTFFVNKWAVERTENKVAAEKLAAVTRAIEQAQTIAKEDAVIAETTAKATEVIRWRTRDRIIKDRTYATAKPLPVECVLDDDRMRNLNDALANKTADSPGQPDYTMPPAAKIGR